MLLSRSPLGPLFSSLKTRRSIFVLDYKMPPKNGHVLGVSYRGTLATTTTTTTTVVKSYIRRNK